MTARAVPAGAVTSRTAAACGRIARLSVVLTAAFVVLQASDAGAQTCSDGPAPPPSGSSGTVDFAGIVPGSTREWTMTVHNEWSVPATLHAELESSGSLAAALRVDVRRCAAAWSVGPPLSCASAEQQLLAPTLLGPGVTLAPAPLAADGWWRVVVRAHLPVSAGNEFQGATGTIRTAAIWEEDCGPTTTTTTPPTVPPTSLPPPSVPTTAGPGSVAPPTLPTDPPSVGPIVPLGVPVASGTDGLATFPDRLPFSGATTWALLLAAGALLGVGTWTLALARRRA